MLIIQTAQLVIMVILDMVMMVCYLLDTVGLNILRHLTATGPSKQGKKSSVKFGEFDRWYIYGYIIKYFITLLHITTMTDACVGPNIALFFHVYYV